MCDWSCDCQGLSVRERERERDMKLKPSFWLCGATAASLLLLFHCSRFGVEVLQAATFFYPWRSVNHLYKLDASWPKNPDHFSGTAFGVAVDPLNSLVYVAQGNALHQSPPSTTSSPPFATVGGNRVCYRRQHHLRGDNVSKVLVFTEEGYFKERWDTNTIEMPHGIFSVSTAKEQSIWITDVGQEEYGHTVKQYSPSGTLLKVLGTAGRAGSSFNPLQFDQPAEIFVEKTGDVYIVDGDGGLNNRLLKLTKDFWLLWTFGGNGTNPGQFYIPHSVFVDSIGRVWVADRGNKRIQVFDKISGEWIGSWSTCFSEDGPYSVRLTADEKLLVVAQLNLNRVLFLAVPPIGDIGDCHVVSTIQMADGVRPHLVDVNVKTGSVYVAEIGAQQVQKYVRYDMRN
ncbi:NHL repeat-containing protein 3 isoform X2 [Ascaphus truei]|uniref:NHL repeat-containing protein 3 isoform X2 n=1 Tax=Ascaphus truei TaxID=8439 RepID=UPI003F5A0E56